MAYKRIVTMQDISCLGQCSLTVALPVLSAAGHETCVLPTAVLSTHTGLGVPAKRDLTEDIPAILDHWRELDVTFDAVCVGYLANPRQIALARELMTQFVAPGGRVILDPAMGDNGTLYRGFDRAFAARLRQELLPLADLVLPNVTEACLLTDTPYREEYGEDYPALLLDRLRALGARDAVLTGVRFSPEEIGVAAAEGEARSFFRHRLVPGRASGAGDLFAAALTGAWLGGLSLPESAALGAEFTRRCLEETALRPVHPYGVKFEPVLGWLAQEAGIRG